MSKNGVVYTTDNCTGCNRCVSTCPVFGVNTAVVEDGKTKIVVDPDKCIQCGSCMDECDHEARGYIDDTDQFFADLKKGEKISLVVASAFFTDFPKEYRRILGYLKKLGVNRIINAGFGADITTWAYIQYIKQKNVKGAVSSVCPSVIDYVEKFVPDLVPKLVPIHSPMMCAAIYLREYLNCTDKVAFLSPCIALKSELLRSENGGAPSYNITCKRLAEKLEGVDLTGCHTEAEMECGLGSMYSVPGGLKQNLEHFLGKDEIIRQIQGEHETYEFLDDYAERVTGGKRLPYIVDALSCIRGCAYGTGTLADETDNEDVMFTLHSIHKKSYKNGKKEPFDQSASEHTRLNRLNQKFSRLRLNDFLVSFRKKAVEEKPLGHKRENEIFESLGKHTEADCKVNCGACGHDSCEEMVRAIAGGYNHKGNCVNYVKNQLEVEKRQILQMTDRLEERQKEKSAIYENISQSFEEMNQSLSDLCEDNEKTALHAKDMANAIEELANFKESLQSSLYGVESFMQEYEKINKEIVSVSAQTNMLALNAGIEAARSGQAGKGFAVIANQVKVLSEKTKTTVENGKENSEKILPAIQALVHKTEEFFKEMEELSIKTITITDNVDNIAGQTEVINQAAENIAEQMKEVID